MLPTFSQNLTLQEAFKTAAQVNEELKRTEINNSAVFCNNNRTKYVEKKQIQGWFEMSLKGQTSLISIIFLELII